MNLECCRAAIVPGNLPGKVLYFGGSRGSITGKKEDWGRVAEYLGRHRVDAPDLVCPPGGLVGAVAYDGSFEFHHCADVCLGGSEELQPKGWEGMLNSSAEPLHWESAVDRDRFVDMVRQAQEAIRRGEIYQINLTRRLSTPRVGICPRTLFRHLWSRTEAPLSSFVQLEHSSLLSASPELFLEISGSRIATQPIKGTRPRGQDGERDEQNAFELRTDPKEIAELVMITDLERNDLGRVCEFGSVHVSELVGSRAFSHVHHLLSTVEGTLRKEVSPAAALQACFPGGSITGAPKRRAMEIIADLEAGPRGYYTGAIGYFGFDGSAHFAMAIRTMECREDSLSFGVGSGITIDSNPAKEFDETNHKAGALIQAVESCRAASGTMAAS